MNEEKKYKGLCCLVNNHANFELKETLKSNFDKSKTYQNQLNKLLSRYKKGYIKELEFLKKIEAVKNSGYKITFEVHRFFESEDLEVNFFYGLEVSQNRPINISLFSIPKIFVSKLVD